MSIEKMHFVGHDGYHALNEAKKQGMFCWWNERFGKVVLYETWRNKNGDIMRAYGGRKSKNGRYIKNVNFIPELAEEIIKIIGMVAGVKSEVSQPTSDIKPEPQVSADHDIKKTIKDIGV